MANVKEIQSLVVEIVNIYNSKGFVDKFGNPRKIRDYELWLGKDLELIEDEWHGVHITAATKKEMQFVLLKLKGLLQDGYDILDKRLITLEELDDKK